MDHVLQRLCTGVTQFGPCTNPALEGSNRCKKHGGTFDTKRHMLEQRRRYKLAQWQERTQELADDDRIQNLNDEIGILRMTLEQVIQSCNSGTDLLLNSPRISDLISKIEKLVVTCSKLEYATSQTLSKQAVYGLAVSIVDIISRYVDDADVVALIADEVARAVLELKNPEEKE